MPITLFSLLPETDPSNQWMLGNDPFQSVEDLNMFVIELEEKIEAISIENYTGYYDLNNVQNFLTHYNELDDDDYYPTPARKVLRNSLASFYDWRKTIQQSHGTQYAIYAQNIVDHTFCEVSQRITNMPQDISVLLNHYGHSLGNAINVSINNKEMVSLASLFSLQEVVDWFAENRSPVRNFQVIEKHGENRQDVRTINGEVVSPLRCSRAKAKELLKSATGHSVDELYNRHGDYYIIFKYEGRNPQNMYHGYHVEIKSNEVPPDIKSILQRRHQN